MKILFIIAISALVVVNLLPYRKMRVSEHTEKIVRVVVAVFVIASAIAYL